MFAVKFAVIEPDGTVTLGGTVTAPLSLDKPIVTPLAGAAPVSTTLQLSLAAPVIALSVQVRSLRSGVFVLLWVAAIS